MAETPPPRVMLSHPMLSPIEPALQAEGWRVARAWELAEADRLDVRAILHAGEVPLTPALLETLPELGLVACVSVGYDGVDVAWCRARGIEVTHAAGLNAEDVAEHALGLVIAAWRDIVAGDRMIREGLWTAKQGFAVRPSLRGRRFGVVGLGAIGQASAARAQAFGVDIAWWGPRPKPQAPWPRRDSLIDLAAWSDILLIASRATAENRGLISREVIEAVGPRGLIVNVARGALVDEDALIAALRDGRLGRAALDVFQTEPTPAARWAGIPNLVLTPHSAGGTRDGIPRMVGQAVENVRGFLAGQSLLSPVQEA